MIYDDNGNPTFLGYAVEPHWGSYWVGQVACKFGVTEDEASSFLERGGPNGRNQPERVVFAWLAEKLSPSRVKEILQQR